MLWRASIASDFVVQKLAFTMTPDDAIYDVLCRSLLKAGLFGSSRGGERPTEYR